MTGSWKRIAAWTRLHAPLTAAEIRPPAAEADIAAARAALDVPEDLIDWWRPADGCGGRESRSGLLPGAYAPFGIADALDERRDWPRTYDESRDGHLLVDLRAGAERAVSGSTTSTTGTSPRAGAVPAAPRPPSWSPVRWRRSRGTGGPARRWVSRRRCVPGGE